MDFSVWHESNREHYLNYIGICKIHNNGKGRTVLSATPELSFTTTFQYKIPDKKFVILTCIDQDQKTSALYYIFDLVKYERVNHI